MMEKANKQCDHNMEGKKMTKEIGDTQRESKFN